jgi:hypothetical protein
MEELSAYRQRFLRRWEQIPNDFESSTESLSKGGKHSRAKLAGLGWPKHIAHVCLAERQLFIPAIQRILTENMPLLDDVLDQELLGGVSREKDSLELLLNELKTMHQDLLAALDNLPTQEWSRMGRHPRLGLRTLQWWLERCMVHADEHLRSVREVAEPRPVTR